MKVADERGATADQLLRCQKRRSGVMRRIARFLVLAACGCGGQEPDEEQPVVCPATAPLFGGTASLPIGMSEGEAEGIVQVIQATGHLSCTGVVVSRGSVLTAAHCVPETDANVVVRVGRDAAHPRAEVPVSAIERVPGYDVAILRFDDFSAFEGVTSIPIASTSLPRRRDEQLAVIAGYGVTESALASGERRFAFVTVTDITDERLVTRATGVSGACIGDSGGPLLWRDETGLLAVFGILSDGDASCRGSDRFVSVAGKGLDAGEPIIADAGCQGLNVAGACFAAELAAWCEDGRLVTERCERGTTCGYSARAAGYRCVEPEQVGCDGYDGWGVCESDRVFRCDDGTLIRSNCTCGECVRDSISGRVGCPP